jgi:hypothetical protein
MTRENIDLQKIRRNWERASASVPVPQHDRLAAVEAPLDVFAAGRQLLDRLRREAHLTFPEQRAALAPFLTRAETSFEALRASGGGDDPKLREALTAALYDLEDICEAFLGQER